jgi:nitrate reductase gamma subunit
VSIFVSLLAVIVLYLAGYYGARAGLQPVFGVVIPYAAVTLFLVGLVYRVLSWARVPVPFRIPTTCGQERSLPWIRQAKLDNPSGTPGVVGRMAMEILLFRSLLRNTRSELVEGKRVVYSSSPWLWLGAMVFHWSMLIIIIRHLRLVLEPVPRFITFLQSVDGVLQIGIPTYYITSFLFIAALLYLLLRRLYIPQLRYISLANDYFPLFLLIGIGISGFWMRYVSKTDIVAVKELVLGLATFKPAKLDAAAPIFYGHLFLVSVLVAYFPVSKLAHMAGVFLSPTRNMANNNRMVRHVNPWDYPVKVHTYEEYEDEFRDKMKAAKLPVEKE